MKNLLNIPANNASATLQIKHRWTLYGKKILNSIILQVDTWAIILIMFGGIIAIGKDSRLIGIVIAVAGIGGLLFCKSEKLSVPK